MKGVIYIIATAQSDVDFWYHAPQLKATAWTAEDAKDKAASLVRPWLAVHVWRWSIPNQIYDKRWMILFHDLETIEEIE